MKTKMSKNLITMACTAALLSACGDMKQDPTTEYKDVSENLVRPHNVKPNEQKFLSGELFDIYPTAGQVLNFIEGEAKSYTIDSRAVTGAVYDVVLTGKPDEGMTLKKGEKPGQFILTWTPPRGHIPNGESDRQHELTFEIVLLPGTDARAQQIFNNPELPIDRTRKHTVNVRRSKQQAAINKITGIKTSVNEGEKFSFQIEVTDPAAHAGNPPRLVPVEVSSSNTELFEANGGSFVTLDTSSQAKMNVEDKGDGVWVFHRVFDTNAAVIPLPLTKTGEVDTNADSVVVRFGYMVIGAGGATSPEKVERVTIHLNKKAEKPEIRFLTGKQSIGLHTGVEREIEFGASVKNPRAKVSLSLEALRAAVSGWPGSPTVTCEDSGADLTRKNCVLTWKVPCEAADLKTEYQLTVEATSDLFGRTEKAQITKTLKIVKNAQVCRTAQQPEVRTQTQTADRPQAGGAQ